jgi:LemA protein
MKKGYIITAGIVLGLFAAVLLIKDSLIANNNRLVQLDQPVVEKISLWQSQIQRQADLLPNLANTVQGAASHERGTQEAVAAARSQVGAISKVDPLKIANDPELQKRLLDAQAAAASAVVRVNAAREQTPNLQAVELFRDLTKEISGTQNRITVARNDSIKAINGYNGEIRQFPLMFWAWALGYKQRPAFEAASQTTPEIRFN